MSGAVGSGTVLRTLESGGSRMRVAMTEDKDVHELVFALCHEIGNLLAASKLATYLLTPGTSDEDLSHATGTISRVASRSGSLLAQIRPLLDPSMSPAENLETMLVLDRLHRGLDDECVKRVSLDLKSAALLPDVRVNPESIHHILLTEIYSALAAEEPDGRVAISTREHAGAIAFQVDHDTSDRVCQGSGMLAGHPLARACAAAVLAAHGGGVEVAERDGSTRVSFIVPACPPPGQ